MNKTLTEKNKKSDILEAYFKLLKDIQQRKIAKPKEELKKKEEETILKETKNVSLEKIFRELTDVKLHIIKDFESIEESMNEQHTRLKNLQKAKEIETKKLNEIHEIQINADSLQALLEGQKQYDDEFEEEKNKKILGFENEMEEKKNDWEIEKENMEIELEEREDSIKKNRKREEEEYNYNLKLKRQKDLDDYKIRKEVLERELLEKKEKLEKDFSEREKIITEKEDEYTSLKTQVDEFSKTLDCAVEKNKTETRESLTRDHTHIISLMKKEIDGERKLYDQKISSLEKKIVEQQKLIDQLTIKAEEASRQVQNIAIKAVEGALPRDREKCGEYKKITASNT